MRIAAVSGAAAALLVTIALTPLSATARPASVPQTIRPSTTAHALLPTLGVSHSFGRFGRGWGLVRPEHLFNGGDPSGHVVDIHWSSWGDAAAYGKGKTWTYKPHGGYYRTKVAIKLKAVKVRRCRSTGRRAYSEMFGWVLNRPGGHFGKRFLWADDHNLCRARHP